MKKLILLLLLCTTGVVFAQQVPRIKFEAFKNNYIPVYFASLTGTTLPELTTLEPDSFVTQKSKAIKRGHERREHDAGRHEPRGHEKMRINREAFVMSGKSARQSAIALLTLGSLKIVAGSMCMLGLTVQDDGIFSVGFPILGGFHILTGAAMLAPGVILLKKSKRQAAAYHGRAYLSVPSLYTSLPMQGNSGLNMGIRMDIAF